MQLWFAHRSEISLREQLVTQVILAILSDDLASGQRLPSTRELARRFRLHPNTASAGYRQLERERWVEFRRGSAVYVRDTKPDGSLSAAMTLDQLVANFLRAARQMGAPIPAVRARLRLWLDLQPPDHFLLIEPNEELRRILTMEMRQGLEFPVESCGMHDASAYDGFESAIPVALPNRAAAVRKMLPAGREPITLHARSVPASLAEWLPAPPGLLVGVASRWPDFLKLGRTILLAAGFHPDGLVFRDARKANWQRGLKGTAAAVVCDTVTAAELPKGMFSVVFPLVSEASLKELREYQEFIRRPLADPDDSLSAK
jgi:DNA-binding transcriptional regulator YhcF (GntR family)